MILGLWALVACGGGGSTDTGPKPEEDHDLDGDGYIAVEAGGDDCWDDPSTTPDAFVSLEAGSQPTAADVHPDAADFPYDAVDADCAGDSDFDLDGDGQDSADEPQRDGSVGTDCNDSDLQTYEGAEEVVADGEDQSCDGHELCYEDADVDGHALEGATVYSEDLDCVDLGEADADVPQDDCDDGAAAVYPGATEVVADGVDEDCDGLEVCWTDDDGDGHGSTIERTGSDVDCEDPGESVLSDDCDDAHASAYPGAPEVCDGVANDCTGEWSTADEAGTISFEDTATGVWSDVTASFAAGTSTSPAAVSVTTEGTYHFCTGAWYGGLTSAGVPFRAEVAEGHAVELTFNGKLGSVFSISDADATLVGFDVTPGKGTAVADQYVGGGVYVSDSGGHVVSLEDVAITRRSGPDLGGGIAAMASATVELHASWVEGSATLGGAVYAEGAVSCFSDGAESAGLFNSDAEEAGGGVYLATDTASYSSDSCDYDGNTPDDVAGRTFEPLVLGSAVDQTFTCTGAAGCTF